MPYIWFHKPWACQQFRTLCGCAICMSSCVCMCVWGAGSWCQMSSLLFSSPFLIWDRVSQWTWTLPILTGQVYLGSKLQPTSCFYSLTAKIINMCQGVWIFPWMLATRTLVSPTCCCRYFTAEQPSQTCINVLIVKIRREEGPIYVYKWLSLDVRLTGPLLTTHTRYYYLSL